MRLPLLACDLMVCTKSLVRAVVQEEDPLSQSPQRSGAELVSLRHTLADIVGRVRSHMVQHQIRIEVCLNIAERRYR